MAYDDNNIFAKILRGEIPCHKIWEDAHSFAFLDIMPRSPGHTLVITKARAENILDISEEDLAHVMAAVRHLAPAIVRAVDGDGFMIQQFNGAAAGQTVFHLHMHIVPRIEGVPLRHHATHPEDDAKLAAVAEKIRAALAEQ